MKKTLRDELPIEPLSDRAWARIEDGLFEGAADPSRLAAPSPVPPAVSRRAVRVTAAAAVVAALAASIAAIVVWQGRGGPAPSSTESFVVTREAGTEIAVDGASLALGPHSALLVRGSAAEGMLIVLDQGSVRCDVEPRRGRPAFAVRAGDVRVTVVGTRFTVQRAGAEVEVAVERGVVDVAAPGRGARLRAGGRWSAPAPASIATPAPLGPDSPEATALDPAVGRARVAGPGGRPVAATAPRAAAALPAASSGHPRGAPRTAPGAAAGGRPRGALAGSVPPPAAANDAAPQAARPQEVYEQGARLEARDPEAAARRYEELARGDGPWAATALFAHARLTAERGQREVAVRLLRQYLARHPDGANAADARALLSRLSP